MARYIRGRSAIRRTITIFAAMGLVGALLSVFTGGDTATASVGERTEVTRLRTATSQTVVNEDGTLTTSLYNASIHYRDAQGAWQRISSRLIPSLEPGYAWQNEAAGFHVFFKQILGPANVRFDVGGMPFTFGLENGAWSRAQPIGSSIHYPGALPGVDLRYDVLSDGLKETLSLASATSTHAFRFILTPPAGMRLSSSLKADGSWAFFADPDDAPLFVLTAPYASDSTPTREARRGELSHMNMSVTRVGSQYAIDLTVDESWLQDPGRQFPVLVDPTVSIQPAVQDASFNASCSSCAGAVSPRLSIGADATAAWRSAFQFDLGDIPSGAQVTAAQLRLYFDGTCLGTSSNCGGSLHLIDLHRITGSWSSKSTTAQLLFNPAPVGTFTLPANASSQWMNWDVTSTVLSWLSGMNPQPNFGLMAKRSVETLGASGPMPPSRTYAEATLQPKLDVTYAGDGVDLLVPDTLRSDGAELKWTTYAGPSPFQSYEVHRSPTSRFTASDDTLITTLNEQSTTFYRDIEATAGGTYTYKIVNGTLPSNERTVTLPADSKVYKTLQPEASAGKTTYITKDVINPNYCANHGARDRSTVGTDTASIHRPLLSFDLSSIPPGSQVTSATLSLWQPAYVNFAATVAAHRVTRAWAEGTGKDECTGDGATWQQAEPGVAWTTPGGDYDSTPVASFASQPNQTGWQTFDVAPLAQQWVGGQVPNHGLLLKFSDESLIAGHNFFYHSDDWTVAPTLRPRLTVSYFGPPENSEPPSILGYNFEAETLTADPGVWRGEAPISYTYQWLRCHYYTGGGCLSISGATAQNYAVPADDLEYSFRVDVTATNSHGSLTEVSAPATPRYSWSYYETTTNRATLKAQGCKTRKRGRMGIVILDFGRPDYQNGAYGTRLFGSGQFASNGKILGAMKSFVDGYNDVTNPDCIPAPQYRNRKLILAWGTNNNYIPENWWPPQPGQPNSREAGQRMARFVQYLSDYMFRFELPMEAAGADDIEFDASHGWRSAFLTVPFIDGFGSVRTNPWFRFYDYGSLDGGPCSVCHQDWTTERQYYKAYGAPHNFPLPEIYINAQARDWARLSRWALDNNRSRIIYPGVTSTPAPGFFTPVQSWRALRRELRRRGVAQQNIQYITQIAWSH